MTLALAVALPLGACYRSVPLDGRPEPGMRVVAHLTREGTQAMERDLGQDMVRVEAEAGAVMTDRWELRMISTWDALGREFPWNRETIAIPHEYIRAAEQREFDARRTWISAAAVTTAVVLLGRAFFKVFEGDEPGRGPTDPVQ
jgi:hypothetical protein